MLMRAETSSLLIVDVQERLCPVMAEPRMVIQGCVRLMAAARELAVPLLVSEQYPKGIGPTMFDLRELAPPEAVVEKLHFSCAHEPAVMERIAAAAGRRQIVMAGIEAHVCVLQSALGLKERGYEVFVVTDACSSRQQANADAAFRRMRDNGIETVTIEMVLFEWLHRAGTPEFKRLLPLVK
ncbi:MAG: hydrolase [Alphaproteobacteria bacterium]|nr:hydrolase [Alphaproteobacteria bacterium]